jgi:hypothetical protein
LLAHLISLHARKIAHAAVLSRVEMLGFAEFELFCEWPMSSAARLSINPMEPKDSARSLSQNQQKEKSP